MPENRSFIAKPLRIFTFCVAKLFIIIILSIISFQVKSQEISKSFFSEKGFSIGLNTYSVILPEENHYRPLLIMGSFGIKLSKSIQKSAWWIMIEPQINPVFLDNQLKEAEFGINLAFRYKYQVAASFFLYAQLGSGPHFITIPTLRQAHGFIFSDNLAVGISKLFAKDWMLNTEFRIRHISNASIMKPNRGMNNLFLVVGLSKRIFK